VWMRWLDDLLEFELEILSVYSSATRFPAPLPLRLGCTEEILTYVLCFCLG
jgi:hypothetical protein